jgi:hypothetical protein
MNSNFRQYYINDPQFYKIVIAGEQPPFDFKLHIFLDKVEEKKPPTRELLTKLMDKL